MLADAGFPAIATTSAGIAFSLGRGDHGVGDEGRLGAAEMLDRVGDIAAAVAVPVNADLEDGFGSEPETVARTIRQAIELGAAGGNIEDWARGRLYDESLAVERIAAARETIDALGSPFVLTARTDALQLDPGDIPVAIARLNRYAAAGADCCFAPGDVAPADVAELVGAIAAPLNVVLGLHRDPAMTVPALLECGVKRISLGGTFARAALAFIRNAAEELPQRERFASPRASCPRASSMPSSSVIGGRWARRRRARRCRGGSVMSVVPNVDCCVSRWCGGWGGSAGAGGDVAGGRRTRAGSQAVGIG